MKEKEIHFFSQEENTEVKSKRDLKVPSLTSSISKTGRLVFPLKTINALTINPTVTRFKVGKDHRKRSIRSLYLVPTGVEGDDSFELVKIGRSYSINLKVIFQNLGFNFKETPHKFIIKPFSYKPGVIGYELHLVEESPTPKIGRRGRRKRTIPMEG